jgi:hypothetical protein
MLGEHSLDEMTPAQLLDPRGQLRSLGQGCGGY